MAENEKLRVTLPVLPALNQIGDDLENTIYKKEFGDFDKDL